MKTLTLLTLSIALALTATHASPADDSAHAELSSQEYRARRMQEKHATKTLAPLDYWGIDGVEWGTEPVAAQATRQLSGLTCRRELHRGASSQGLNQVTYHFASGITNRAERLRQFQQLKSELLKTYSQPTHRPKGDSIVRGQDAYVQGLDKEYRLEWHGPETILTLALSDASLSLQFRQAPTSRVGEHRQNVKRAQEKQKRMAQQSSQTHPHAHRTAIGQ